MNTRRRAFVNAYLGEAKGNGTKAAIIAGYSEATAAQAASRMLRQPDVQKALETRLENADLKTDAILKRLGRIIHAEPKDIKGADIVNASKLVLQVNGDLHEKSDSSRVVVNIGFLNPSDPQPVVQVIEAGRDNRD